MAGWFINVTYYPNKKSSLSRLLFLRSMLDIVLPQAREKRSHPSADFQVINGVPNADYCHLKAVGFALLGKFSVTDDACVNPSGSLVVVLVRSAKSRVSTSNFFRWGPLQNGEIDRNKRGL